MRRIPAVRTGRIRAMPCQSVPQGPADRAFNRRAFLAYGERLIMRHRVEKKPLCLVLFDLDQFKELNHRFGHIGGDQFLTTFVAVAYKNIRPGGFLFRLGGDEFCCLLPETDASEALKIAERMRRRIAATTMHVADEPVNVTASVGIASTESFGYSLDALLHEADIATYAAKGQGRNQVVVAAPGFADACPESQESAPAGVTVAFSGAETGGRVRREA